MKLSTTITDNRIATNTKLNYVCGNYVCETHIDKSIQALFIESVNRANLLTEAQMDTVTSFLKAQLSKAQAALTPDTSEDLGTLLAFVAPSGGGIAKVKNLLRLAKQSRTDIRNNTQWWDDLFNTFNITNDATKQRLLKKFGAAKEKIQPTASDRPGLDEVEAPPIAGTVPATGAATGAATPQGELSQLEQMRDLVASMVKRDEQMASLRKSMSPEVKSGFKDNIAKLNARLDEIDNEIRRAKKPRTKGKAATYEQIPETPAESFITTYAQMLLEFPQVCNNLPTIVRTMIPGNQKITIKENGILVRTKQAIGEGFWDKVGRRAGEMITNPRKAKSRYNTGQIASNNERTAKLAVQALTGMLREKFVKTLKDKNITPEQVTAALKKYSMYRQYRPEALNPTQQAEYQRLQKQLLYTYKLFKPMDAKIVPDQPAAAAAPAAAAPAAAAPEQPVRTVLHTGTGGYDVKAVNSVTSGECGKAARIAIKHFDDMINQAHNAKAIEGETFTHGRYTFEAGLSTGNRPILKAVTVAPEAKPATAKKSRPIDAATMATSGKLISYLEKNGLSPKDAKWLRDRPQLKPSQILKILKDYRNLTGAQITKLVDKFGIKWD